MGLGGPWYNFMWCISSAQAIPGSKISAGSLVSSTLGCLEDYLKVSAGIEYADLVIYDPLAVFCIISAITSPLR